MYFSERVVNIWNRLSPEIINFSSLASFRRSLEATDLEAHTGYFLGVSLVLCLCCVFHTSSKFVLKVFFKDFIAALSAHAHSAW